ncbi:MAG TPA: hypothetical protein VD860_13025 [Azospirillum sp.]|nr:hypothetical protein [Azospirillum sp.]
MRETVYTTPHTTDRAAVGVEIRPGAHRRVIWGAVFAGVVLTFAVQLLLSLLGLGIGMTTIDPAQAGATPAASSLSIGAGAWWTVSYMVALAIGGYVAARLAGVGVRGDGVIHGLLTWAFALLVSAFLVTSVVGSAVSGAFNMLGSMTSGLAQTAKQAAPEAMRVAGVSPEDLRNRAEGLLRSGDQPAQSRDEALRQLAQNLSTIATNGQGADQARQQAASIIAQQAGIPEDQARQRVDQFEQQARQTTEQVQQTATQAAERASDTASQAGIWGTLALLLGAAAAALGGGMGARWREQHHVVQDVA